MAHATPAAAPNREPTTFLSLPGEIRNEIYTLSLCHQENAGVISPLPLTWWKNLKKQKIWTVMDGQEEYAVLKDTMQKHREPRSTSNTPTDDEESDELLKPQKRVHICTTRCLKQPALTCVSRQVRDESLALFYDVNRFHLETEPFRRYDPDSSAAYVRINPRMWWRNIGDSNLRLIRHLRIAVGRHENGDPKTQLEIIRTDSQETFDVRLLEKLGRRVITKTVDLSLTTPELKECVEQMKAGGAFVRGIEKALETTGVCGIKEVDWPSVQRRPKGLRRVSGAWGGDSYVYVEGLEVGQE